MWSRNHACCERCQTTATPHMAKGLCKICYQEKYRSANPAPIAKAKRRWYEKNIRGTDAQKIAREQRNYDGQREEVLKRDDYRCVRCGSTKSLVVHHKDRSGRGQEDHNNDTANLETLCRKCHIAEHRAEILAIRKASGFKRRKLGRWSRKWNECQHCHTTRLPHSAHGYCRGCKAHCHVKI